MHGCNGCDPYGAVNEDCPIHGNPAHEETRSRLAEVSAERDALVEGVAEFLAVAEQRNQARADLAALQARYDELRRGVERVERWAEERRQEARGGGIVEATAYRAGVEVTSTLAISLLRHLLDSTSTETTPDAEVSAPTEGDGTDG